MQREFSRLSMLLIRSNQSRNINIMARTSLIKAANRSSKSEAHASATFATSLPSIKRDYPGLGLPLRHNPQDEFGFYPIGAHGSCYGADSDLLPVRELAMMSVMDKLTDKPDWEKKVFDEDIVSKWRKEALAIPDADFWHLSVSGKSQHWEDGEVVASDDWWARHLVEKKREPPQGIMTDNTFDCVSLSHSKILSLL